jgi:putative nucleotidyltransferase with HDIG domain
MASQRLPRSAQLLVTAVAVAGACVLVDAARELAAAPPAPLWLLLAGLTIFSSSFPLRAPGVTASLSLSEALVFTSLLTFGPAPALLTVALDGLTLSLKQRQVTLARVVFNITQPALSLYLAARLFTAIVPRYEVGDGTVAILRTAVGVITLAASTFAITSSFNALVVSLSARRPFWATWSQLRWVSLNYFAGASLAAMLTQRAGELNYVALALLGPLLGVFYLTFSNWVARSEEAQQHLNRLNKLYLSTIETLAMAIDAKDQVTHGHIRRVQALATGLARRLGVDDSAELKAIEAAALLHDMGKLAIPEHILNKPGKLSPAEFEQMKQHAAIGADILARIEFPYPVVPIVRHHHEWWNGGGYPDGISGAAIPIGARVLSVVDCYDALTSDRPYRRALSDEEAFEILMERRGNMYDPMVVDMFQKVYKELASACGDLGADDHPLADIDVEAAPASAPPAEVPREPPVGVAADAPWLAVLHRLANPASLAEAVDEVAGGLMARTPARLVVLYLYDGETDTLRARLTFGVERDRVRGLSMAMGQRLTGWVAANRRAICNSDPALDLSAAATPLETTLRSSLCVPLTADGHLVGVLGLYAPDANAFADADRQLVEGTAPVLGPLVGGLLNLERVERSTRAGLVDELPALDGASADEPASARCRAVIVVRHDGPGALMPLFAATLARHLRPDDRLLRDEDGLIAVLDHAVPEVADAVASRLRTALTTLLDAEPLATPVTLSLDTACATGDATLADLVARAKAAGGDTPSATDRPADPIRLDQAS